MSPSEEKRRAWAIKLQSQRESGLPIERWCRENQVPFHNFRYWKMRLTSPHPITRSSFTELIEAKRPSIVIEYREAKIHLNGHFESALLKQCLTVLEELKC